jgi:hypothetical protein
MNDIEDKKQTTNDKEISDKEDEKKRDHCGCGSQKYLSGGRHHYPHDHAGWQPK